MSRFNDVNTWFEQELNSSYSVDSINFDAVEATLSRRIKECESLGILGLLRKDELCEDEKFEHIEHDLFLQITQYSEYDEPANECLSTNHDLTEKQWDRITTRIEDRLAPVMQLPLWEQYMLAPQEEPTVGYWEAFEIHLIDRINRLENQVADKWEQFEIKDEPVATSSLERAEMLLEEHIAAVAARPAWEHVLSADKIVPQHRWEVMETSLFDALEEKRSLSLRKQPFWYIIEHYASLFKGVAAAAVVTVIVVSSYFGMRSADHEVVSSILYQTEGAGAVQYNMNDAVGKQCSMGSDGKITFVNVHGYVALHNSSSLTIEKLSQREARYQVSFASEKGDAGGDVTFFVRKKDTRRNFSVVTPHYRIEVRGTYFRVESAPNGSVTTRVLEGSVRLKGSPVGDMLLTAGQSIALDTLSGKYRVFDGGEMVPREEAENIPDFMQVVEYPVVEFSSSVAGAHVYIDGRLKGVAPLRVRLPEGHYRTWIRKKGFVAIDTMLQVTRSKNQFAFVCTPEKKRRETKVKGARNGVAVASVTAVAAGEVPASTALSAGAPVSKVQQLAKSANWYDMAQKAERDGNWRKAIDLYKKVFNAPGTTPLRREDVLFSVAKLQADHLNDAAIAKQSFLTYIALFPEGSFAGESWLRLAELEFQKSQESAIHYYLKFFGQFPRHPRTAELKDRVGVIYLQQKQFDKAIAMFDQALSGSTISDALSESVATHLHRALVDKGDYRRAEVVRTRYLLSER